MFRPTTLLRTPLLTSTTARSFSTTRPSAYKASVNLIGYLAGAAEEVKSQAGRDYVKYTVAVKAGSKENPKSNFFRISAFPQNPEYLLNIPKGSLINVEGELQTYTREDEEGRKQTIMTIVQRNITTLRRNPNAQQEQQ